MFPLGQPLHVVEAQPERSEVAGSLWELGVGPQAIHVAHGVVVPRPTFNEHLGLQQRVELFTSQQLVAESAVTALAVAVFPQVRKVGRKSAHVGAEFTKRAVFMR